MGWTPPSTIPHAPGNPVASQALLGAMLDDLDYLFSTGFNLSDLVGVPVLQNNSFEADPNGTSGASMTAWTFAAGTGGTGTVVNTEQNHGSNSFKMTQDTTAGHTAGTLTNNDFLAVSPNIAYRIRFLLKCSAADVKNQLAVQWFDSSQSQIGSDQVLVTIARGSSPTSWKEFVTDDFAPVTSPSVAVWMKVKLLGGQDTGTPPAATTSIYWDGIQIVPRPALSTFYAVTSTQTVTIPPGSNQVAIRAWARTFTNLGFGKAWGGYAEHCEKIQPGQTVVITINNASGASSTLGVGASTTITLVNGNNSTGANGTSTGANLNAVMQGPLGVTVLLMY